MGKNKFLKIAIVTIFATIAGYGVYTSNSVQFVSNLALTNVDALAYGEGVDKYAEKVCTTRSEGPYYDSIGRTYYIDTTITDCFGYGVVDCEPGVTSTIRHG